MLIGYLGLYLLGLALGALAMYLRGQRQLQFILSKQTTKGFTNMSQVRQLLDRQAQDMEQLQVQLANTRTLLAGLPLGYLAVDQDNRLLDYNPRAAQLLGLNPGQQRLLIEEVRSWELDNLVERTRESGSHQTQEWSCPSPVGQQPLRVTTLPLQGRAVGIFLEDRHEAVNLANRRDQWTADVAHELKTPLTAMHLVMEMLKNRVEPEHGRWLERLLKEVQRLTSLVDDLLCLQQIATDRQIQVHSETLDIVGLLRECWQMLEPLAQAKMITLVIEAPAVLEIKADPALLHRAFLNLLDNGVKFSPSGSQLLLCLVQNPTQVIIDLQDQGAGFPPEDLERVFERFYRADPARSRQTGGTGLGLALVREIIQAHQGTVQASNLPQGGACLRVVLPV